jgi:hypothetical protein
MRGKAVVPSQRRSGRSVSVEKMLSSILEKLIFLYSLFLCFFLIDSVWKLKSPNSLLICTWFLKNQFGKIKYDKLDFKSILNLIFTACVACKNQFQNLFLQAKNPVFRTWFFQLDFSKFKCRSTGGKPVCRNSNLSQI